MNILIATHDFDSRKAHLMPWRVIDEVAVRLRRQSCNVTVVSLVQRRINRGETPAPDGVVRVAKLRDQLAAHLRELIDEQSIDVIFWPLTWREPRWRLRVLDTLRIAKVGYFPGGIYSIRACIYALRKLGLTATAPYLADSIVSKRRLIQLAMDVGITDFIALSETTALAALGSGWSQEHVHYIPPGKEVLAIRDQVKIPELTSPLKDHPFFLFMGPPSGIRGIHELLDAFEIVARRNSVIQLICLFRPDDELDSAKIKQVINRSGYKDRIHTKWTTLDRPTLDGYVSKATAIVIPFILVPAEIPLAIIEALALNKPVIATSPGGTGNFVKQFGFSPRVGDIRELADAMLSLVENVEIYNEKCRQAQRVYEALNDWSEMADSWLNVARRATSSSDENEH
jgi:glycosyltransferase involved in cell wall biosynthesis